MSEAAKKILVLAGTGLSGVAVPVVALAASRGFVFVLLVMSVWFAAAMWWCGAEDRRTRRRDALAGNGEGA